MKNLFNAVILAIMLISCGKTSTPAPNGNTTTWKGYVQLNGDDSGTIQLSYNKASADSGSVTPLTGTVSTELFGNGYQTYKVTGIFFSSLFDFYTADSSIHFTGFTEGSGWDTARQASGVWRSNASTWTLTKQ